jgi:hypothetical protein
MNKTDQLASGSRVRYACAQLTCSTKQLRRVPVKTENFNPEDFDPWNQWVNVAQDIIAELRLLNLDAELEYIFIGIRLQDGRCIAFGCVDDTWMGDVYDGKDGYFGNLLEIIDTSIPSSVTNAKAIAAAVSAAITNLGANSYTATFPSSNLGTASRGEYLRCMAHSVAREHVAKQPNDPTLTIVTDGDSVV